MKFSNNLKVPVYGLDEAWQLPTTRAGRFIMKFDYLAKRLGLRPLAFFILLGVVTFGASTAQAQWS
jgi:hypothetical protein